MTKGWMFDGGEEFKNEKLDNFIKEKGIELKRSILYTLQQNEHAKIFNRTLIDKVETI